MFLRGGWWHLQVADFNVIYKRGPHPGSESGLAASATALRGLLEGEGLACRQALPHRAGPCSLSPSSGRGVSAALAHRLRGPLWAAAGPGSVRLGRGPSGTGWSHQLVPTLGQAPLASLWPVVETQGACPGKGVCSTAGRGRSGVGPDSAGFLGPEGSWKIDRSGGFKATEAWHMLCSVSLILACPAPE